MLRLQAAALPLALNTTEVTDEYVAGNATAAMGLSAALTALSALAMPVPHSPEGGQAHSRVFATEAGQTGNPPVLAGKGVALASNRDTNCFGVRLPLTARMRPAMPATMGAEK